MLTATLAIVLGLVLLVWSADRFVDGSAATAKYFGVPPLIIGMVVIGFGTSAPEMFVSALASIQGNPGIALGNAYGSNIANIALILGLTALIKPVIVQSSVIKKELPILTVITVLTIVLLSNFKLTRLDAVILLLVFAMFMFWIIRQSLKSRKDAFTKEVEQELNLQKMGKGRALFWMLLGLVFLIISSRILVWGSVELAHYFGVSDLIIGLTIVALGTSLPELASAIVAVRKNEHDLVLGNILGSNIFNTLAVVGIAGVIHPLDLGKDLLYRDILVMSLVTVSLFIICYGFKANSKPRINRLEGAFLVACYLVYIFYLGINL